MNPVVQPQSRPAKLIFLTDKPIVQSKSGDCLVIKNFLPQTTQIEVNSIICSRRIAYYIEGEKETGIYVTSPWFKKIKEHEPLAGVLFLEENEKKVASEKKYVQFKGKLKINLMSEKKESEFEHLKEKEGAVVLKRKIVNQMPKPPLIIPKQPIIYRVAVGTISEADKAIADTKVNAALLEVDGIIRELDEAIERVKAKRKLENSPTP